MEGSGDTEIQRCFVCTGLDIIIQTVQQYFFVENLEEPQLGEKRKEETAKDLTCLAGITNKRSSHFNSLATCYRRIQQALDVS